MEGWKLIKTTETSKREEKESEVYRYAVAISHLSSTNSLVEKKATVN